MNRVGIIVGIIVAMQEELEEILNIMKNSINDLKLFNKINDQYYCLDVPINFKENEIPNRPAYFL